MRRPDPKLFVLAASVIGAMACLPAHAGEKRIEYRYPDRPDLVYSSNGVARAEDPNRPLAFSKFESAISVADARSVIGPSSNDLVSEAPRRVAPKSSFDKTGFTSAAVVPSYDYTPPAAPVASAPTPAPTYTPAVASGFAIQTGAFSSYSNASELAARLSVYGSTRISEGYSNGKTVYRVLLGGWNSKDQAQPMLQQIKARGYDGFVTRAS